MTEHHDDRCDGCVWYVGTWVLGCRCLRCLGARVQCAGASVRVLGLGCTGPCTHPPALGTRAPDLPHPAPKQLPHWHRCTCVPTYPPHPFSRSDTPQVLGRIEILKCTGIVHLDVDDLLEVRLHDRLRPLQGIGGA